jgi:hypothetical protein
MAAEIIQINPIDFEFQTYENQDINLITSFDVATVLSSSSYLEFFIYDINKSIVTSNYNFTKYTVQNNGQSAGNNNDVAEIILDPENILIDSGFDQGTYITYFNFFNKKLGSSVESLYIAEISSDRTEIRLDSTVLSNLDIVEKTLSFIQERENSPYFLDFYLNFGDNQLAIANNIKLDNEDTDNPTVLIKLYEPLSEEFDLNSLLWIVTSLEESIAYQVTFEEVPIVISDTVSLKGPNFNLDIKDRVNNSTLELSYQDLITTSLTSSQNQLNSLLEEKELDINIDYTDFNNFIHFSSVKTRIENFYYKVKLIEQYTSLINTLNNTTNSPVEISSSISVYESKINNIITNFDGYDYYLYYSSGSLAYPKTTIEPPYQLYPSDSSTVLSWLGSDHEFSPYYGGILLSASVFDNLNPNNLYYSIPEYLRDDSSNEPYELFVEMVGQFYDNIWIYYKDVSEKYNTDNRLEYGVSKDIVADAIRDFGVKLYQNNFSNVDLYTAFLGLTPDGALFPFPEITGSLPTPTGFEYVDTLISASNDYMPLDDVNKSLYKRIYHNLPYLLKAKGTLPGLRALITSYGIPDTILRINEYGGKDKVDSNDWDYWQNEFNYALSREGNNYMLSEWSLNPDWNSPDDVPSTLAFRFKPKELLKTNIPYSQSLWYISNQAALTLTYTGSGYVSGSYSGSIIDPYYQYATLTFFPDAVNYPNSTASVYLPFFDGGWWSTMVTRDGNDFVLYAGNKIYEGGDNGTLLGFFTSSSIIENSTAWTAPAQASTFGRLNNLAPGGPYDLFSGSYQEVRYYNTVLKENIFKDYIMNPYSIEGNSLNSGLNELAFRASLGGELYTGSVSIHPKVTGSWVVTSSFVGNSDFGYNLTPTFVPNTEYFFYDQPVAGIKNTVSDKIRLENDSLPSGSVLSPLRALSQITAASASYTANINYLEVAFSPQNEINEDIMDQLGFFNIGDYIGDPAFRFSPLQSYPNLDNLRDAYFEKYTKNYDLVDFIRLIKFFDNSLFKMIKDFVPARTSLASGVVIKQHLLERNRYPQPQVGWENLDISGAIKSTQVWDHISQSSYISHSLIETFSGGTAGSFEIFNGVNTSPYGPNGTGPENIFGITQSWSETYQTISGSVTILHDAQDEFYDGEFSGSVILVTTQSLNQPYPLDNISFNYKHVFYYGINQNQTDTFEYNFLNSSTVPKNGEILFYNYKFKGYLSNPTLNTYTTTFIKIAKVDCDGNDNSLPLGQINTILVYNPNQAIIYPSNYALNFDEYNIISINEYSDYYLYEVNRPWDILSIIGPIVDPHDNQVFDYTISSSVTASYNVGNGSPKTIINWNATSASTNLPHYGTPYFNTSSGILTFENTPNVPLILSASITSSGIGFPGSSYPMSLIQNRNNTETIITSNIYSTLGTSNVLLTASLYPIQGDQYYIRLEKPAVGGSINITNAQFYLYQDWDNFILDTFYGPSTSSCAPVILEPYITTPNFYNSDQNALINNAENARLSTIYQDVDYTPGILTPTNFNLLINNEAAKAPVQDSNYTTKRHTIPRYEGSKSTSQKLNKWTPGDEGTFGKLPTVENLKIWVAYADTIGGYTPDRMNCSGIVIKYLIDQDGNISVPNTTENSLYYTQGTFLTGEKISIDTNTLGSGETQYRNIIKGGYRIEPILYTQIGHTPPSWTSSIQLFNENSPTLITDNSCIAVLVPNSLNPYAQDILNIEVPIGEPSYSNGWDVLSDPGNNFSVYVYNVDNQTISEGVDLIIDAQFVVENTYSNPIEITFSPYKSTAPGDFLSPPETYVINPNTIRTFNFNYNLTPEDNFIATDEFFFSIKRNTPPVGSGTLAIRANESYFKLTQYPLPNPLPPITVTTNSIWDYPSSSLYTQYSSSQNGIIYIPTPSSSLNAYYNTPGVQQKEISGSGFQPITLDWNIKIGDEFRFEGREDRTYLVKKIFSPIDQSPERISNTGSVEVHLNNALPSSSINLDHFLIRRYVDDSSAIIFEGFKPNPSGTGPYIITPEYVSPKLNKDIDQFILDLTQKGLL